MTLDDLGRLVAEAPREALPDLLGALAAAEARCRLRLAEPVPPAALAEDRLLDADEAAQIAGTSRRWLLAATRGMRFRRDLSRKQARFDETGLRAWLASRRTR